MTWAFVAATIDDQALGELTLARDRKVTFDLRGPATAGFTLDGLSDQARELTELATDLHVWRDQTHMLRARIGSTDDDLDADRHTTTFSAIDYRGMLAARIDETGRTYDGWQQADIGWDLIQVAQAGAGGPLGITRGVERPAVVARTEVVEPDTKIDSVLDRLQDYQDGAEWWVDPQLQLQMDTWRGVARDDFPLAYGSTVTSVKRAYDTGLYANWVKVRGSRPDGADPEDPEPVAYRWATDLASRREGRIARVVQNTDLKTQEAVDAAADQLLADSLNPPASYTVTITPGLWSGPADLWLGDRAPLIVRSGRLDIAATCRVSQIDIGIDDDGNETIQLTVGTE